MAADGINAHSTISAQAANARMKLELRALEREAAAAEADAEAIDGDAAVRQLRARLDPMIEERRTFLQNDLDRVRAEVDAEVVAARAAAADAPPAPLALPTTEPERPSDRTETEIERLAMPDESAGEPHVNGQHPALEAGFAAPVAADVVAADVDYYADLDAEDHADPDAEPHAQVDEGTAGEERHAVDVVDLVVGDEDEVDPDADDLGVEADPADPDGAIGRDVGDDDAELIVDPLDWDRADGLDDLLADEESDPEPDEPSSIAVEVPGQVSPPAVRDDGTTQVNVVIDAEAFARAFAAVLKPVLEARQQQGAQPPVMPHYRIVEPEPRKSFWSQAWHADVLLALAAIVIVVIVLFAWTG